MREKDIPVGFNIGIACVIMPPCVEERLVFTSLGDSLRDSEEHNVKLFRDGVIYRAKSLRHISKNEYLSTNKTLYLQQ
jgi:hypothetical protein